MSQRLDKIKTRLFDKEYLTKKEWWGKDTTILTSDEIRKEPIIVRKALAMNYVMQNMPVEVKPDELIVGISNMAMVGFGHVFPEYALPEEKEWAAERALNEMSVWGHHPVDYETLLNKGAKYFREKAENKLLDELKKQNPDEKVTALYRSMIMTLNGLKEFSVRYSDLTLKEALKEKDPVRRAELFTISRICLKVPEEPAETLHEALQGFWLTFIVFHSCVEFLPVGRGDQYLYPFYKRDIEAGRITKEFARELVGSFIAKFNERVQVKPEHWEDHFTYGDFSQGSDPIEDTAINVTLDNASSYNYGISANHWLMNLIIGGMTPDGKDGTNDLTYIILDVWSELEAIAPVLSVRFHPGSPEKLFEECAKILRSGSGEPALYNDVPIIEGLTKLGIPLEEARDYSNDGCWETLIPGKSDYSYVHIEVLQMLEYVLFQGWSLVRNEKESEDFGNPEEFKDFEEFYQAFQKQLYRRIDYVINNKKKHYGEVERIAPDPLLSAMMNDCIERGREFTNGGAKYVIHGPLITGLSNCVDSLAVIKKMVYEEKSLTIAQLKDLLKTNFKDNEMLRQMLIKRVPKFGNDDDYVDSLAVRILNDADKRMEEHRKTLDWLYIAMGIGTFESYARFGNVIGASADGRMSQESLSSNFSPSIGMDTNGPTAVVRSTVKPDLLPYCNGCPVDIQMNSNEVVGEDGIKRMVGLMRGFMDMGGIIFTITGVSREMLEDARDNPEKHRGLRVRLGGLSAYFIALSPKHQEIMINKTKHG